jgi:hypothetical protein
MLLALVSSSWAANMKQIDLNNKSAVYALGREIAEGVALSIVTGMSVVDSDLEYEFDYKNETVARQDHTVLFIDVLIKITSQKIAANNISFDLILNRQPAGDSGFGYVLGIVKNIKVDGHNDNNGMLNALHNSMFIETDEGTVQVGIQNGRLVIYE